mmetsp:Transcript_7656/g.19754  ORF Transcript_7656/g.19754 Transcript_7656/m.19754 type:complete len:260 (+) Transcript_7656:98-877(+)
MLPPGSPLHPNECHPEDLCTARHSLPLHGNQHHCLPRRPSLASSRRGAVHRRGCAAALGTLEVLLRSRHLLQDVNPSKEEGLLLGLHLLLLHPLEPGKLGRLGCLALRGHLGDELLLLLRAVGRRGRVALALQLVLDKLLERVEVAAARIRVALGVSLRGEVLDGWVARHVVVRREISFHSAVNIADHNRRRALESGTEVLPCLFHGLAVPSPRRLELDEGVLARVLDFSVEVRLGEHGRAGVDHRHEGGKCDNLHPRL